MRQKSAKKRRCGVLERIVILALLAVFLVSAFMLAQYYFTSATEKAANSALAEQVDTDAEYETDEDGVFAPVRGPVGAEQRYGGVALHRGDGH
ncbi:MAG: hypothetical protein LUG44_03150 [Clostridiales bacterium]|nr:hypothetical protein [Clostridiales bacterium]